MIPELDPMREVEIEPSEQQGANEDLNLDPSYPKVVANISDY